MGWMVYGLCLPDEVLEKIYSKNALKILNLYKGDDPQLSRLQAELR